MGKGRPALTRAPAGSLEHVACCCVLIGSALQPRLDLERVLAPGSRVQIHGVPTPSPDRVGNAFAPNSEHAGLRRTLVTRVQACAGVPSWNEPVGHIIRRAAQHLEHTCSETRVLFFAPVVHLGQRAERARCATVDVNRVRLRTLRSRRGLRISKVALHIWSAGASTREARVLAASARV